MPPLEKQRLKLYSCKVTKLLKQTTCNGVNYDVSAVGFANKILYSGEQELRAVPGHLSFELEGSSVTSQTEQFHASKFADPATETLTNQQMDFSMHKCSSIHP